MLHWLQQMRLIEMNEPTSVVKRVYTNKAVVLDKLASDRKWSDIITLDEVIETSALFQEARRQYELSDNVG